MQGWSLGCLHIGNIQVLICLQNYSKKDCSWGSRGSLEAPTGLALRGGCTCSSRPGPQWQCGGCGATREDSEEPCCPVTLVCCSRHFGEAVSPACQLLFTIYLLDHYEIGKNLSNLGIQALICTLRGSKDTEWLPRATSSEKKPQWICPTLNVQPERSFAMGLSPHPAHRCPGGSCSAWLRQLQFSAGAWYQSHEVDACRETRWIWKQGVMQIFFFLNAKEKKKKVCLNASSQAAQN